LAARNLLTTIKPRFLKLLILLSLKWRRAAQSSGATLAQDLVEVTTY